PEPIAQPDPLDEAARTTDVVARLLAPLNADQQRAVNLIASQLETGRWPIFDFIDREFERDDIAAVTVLDSLPGVAGNGEYVAAWSPRPPSGRPAAEERLRLTILGLHHVEDSQLAD